MFVQAVDQTSLAYQLGELLSLLVVLLVGGTLLLAGRSRKAETRGAKGQRMFGWGVALLVLGAAMIVSQFVATSDDTEASSRGAVSKETLLAVREQTIKQPFHVVGTTPGHEVDSSYVGGDAKGTRTEGDVTVRFVKVGDDFFIRPNEGFWKVVVGKDAAAVTDYVGSRWVLLDPTSPILDSVRLSGDKAKIIEQALPATGTPPRGRSRTIRGVDCFSIQGVKGSAVYVDEKTSRVMQLVDVDGVVVDVYYDQVDQPKAPRRFIVQADVIEPA